MSGDVTEVLALMAAELDLDQGEIGPDSTIDDVDNWDSLGHLRVCMALEARYGVTIPMDQVGELRSVPAILALLAGPGGRGGPSGSAGPGGLSGSAGSGGSAVPAHPGVPGAGAPGSR